MSAVDTATDKADAIPGEVVAVIVVVVLLCVVGGVFCWFRRRSIAAKIAEARRHTSFKTIIIENKSDKIIEARIDNKKVTHASNTIAASSAKEANVGVHKVELGVKKSDAVYESNKDNVSEKINYGWIKITPDRAKDFEIYDEDKLFYVSIRGHAEDQAFNPVVKRIIWDGDDLSKFKGSDTDEEEASGCLTCDGCCWGKKCGGCWGEKCC
eukprot:87669_1